MGYNEGYIIVGKYKLYYKVYKGFACGRSKEEIAAELGAGWRALPIPALPFRRAALG
jgi:hypothetical protein